MACNSSGIIIGDSLGEVYILNSITSTERKFLTKVQGKVNSVVARGNLVVVAGNQENLVIVEGTEEKHIQEGNRASILTVSISPNTKNIASIGFDGWIYLYVDFKLVKKTQITSKIKENTLEQFLGEFSPDSSCFALPGDLVFNYLQGPEWKYIPTRLACKQNISIIRWPLKNTLITASIDYQLKIWDIENCEIIQSFTLSSNAWDFLYTGKAIFVALTGKNELFTDIKLQKITEILKEEEPSSEKNEKNEENETDNALFERTLGIYPQEPIIPINPDKSISVLFRSALGTIISREYKLLKEINDHTFIVKLYDIFYTYSEKGVIQNLVFEYLPMNLSKYIRDQSANLSFKEISLIFRQILRALDYLHSKNIIHIQQQCQRSKLNLMI